MGDDLTRNVSAGFAAIAGSFIMESLEHMIPWLIVSAAVVVCDLAFGLRKAMMMGEDVRLSSAVRRTMGKMVTYFAFVCMIVMIDIASGMSWHIDIYSCLLICFVEMCSIMSNYLKPKGVNFNIVKAVAVLLSRIFKIDKKDIEDVVSKD